MKERRLLMAAVGLAALAMAGGAKATTYVNDTSLSDFANASTTFATLSNYNAETFGLPPAVYPTTFTSLQTGGRVYSGGTLPGLTGSNWLLATFATPMSAIRVFPSIDHAANWDAYQYQILGSNNGTTWTPLFDATGATSSAPFELTSSTGTAPFQVDAVDTPNCAGADCVGYIASFDFGTPYKFYAFGPSTLSRSVGNINEELSGVSGLTIGVPEPASWALLLGGLGFVGAALRSSRRKVSLITA